MTSDNLTSSGPDTSYSEFHPPANPYPLTSIAFGHTSAESDHNDKVPSVDGGNGPTVPIPADGKTRLRKACDSCSARKVKVINKTLSRATIVRVALSTESFEQAADRIA